MLFGIILGRLACGFLCPFGLIQDLLYKIPIPKIGISQKIDKPARYIKYVILLIIVILLPAFGTTKSGITPPYFCKYICPAGTLGGGIPHLLVNSSLRQAAGTLFQWKMFVFLLVIVLSILIYRPFCRYLCPLGAFYSLFNQFGFYQMYLDKSKCISCKKCEQHCPMAVQITKNINSTECIRCGKCKSICPTHAISSGFHKNIEKE